MTAIEATFRGWLDARVCHAARQGVCSFAELVDRLPGVYPAEVRDSLARCGSNRSVAHATVQALLNPDIPAGPVASLARQKCLPLPHPLDYEWRFSEGGADALIDACAAFTSDKSTLALLGAPSVALVAAARWPGAITVFDANSHMIDALRAQCPRATMVYLNLLDDELPPPCADLALLDPPWYPDHLYGFFWAACAIVALGGYVLAVLPPIGTRPGIADERARLIAWCADQGLRMLEIRDGAASYSSPLFEVNALRAASIPPVSRTWRRGDLCVFQKVGCGPIAIRPTIAQDARIWREWTFGPVRIRVRSREPSNGDPRLIRLVPGDILPSVSRRDERRDSAVVWTSGNRIFDCRAPDALARVLFALQQTIHLNGVDGPMLAEASEQVLRFINVEHEEVARYFEQAT